MDDKQLLLQYIRSISIALVAVALSILTAGLITIQQPLAVPFLIAALIACIYALVFVGN
ncbi:hypothetical protein KM295_16440 [Natronomonas sp. F2-12]|uniref:Uncharacterized protein n=1 Tax=Natronomonas aquatica TaxID=2841590 RepID=A0A9R1D653_9EURY|nr:hypothetical protein [Natronomonas aquatica]MCQ4335039.1 hypothetical protein [Natronomonas aquatica]